MFYALLSVSQNTMRRNCWEQPRCSSINSSLTDVFANLLPQAGKLLTGAKSDFHEEATRDRSNFGLNLGSLVEGADGRGQYTAININGNTIINCPGCHGTEKFHGA